jgi:hypothetical protein
MGNGEVRELAPSEARGPGSEFRVRSEVSESAAADPGLGLSPRFPSPVSRLL